ncbi:MAG: serine/threonine protein kinase [Planctomycetota bacterium]|jgi:tetratricopeptide (TPR) repeat protein
MGGDRFEEARDLFLAVLDVSPSERAAFLADRCGDDRPLRAEVERLLAEDAATDSFMVAPATAPNETAAAGKRIGRYEIRHVIGAGGMGTVYEAVQDHPHRTVALKVLRHGAASRRAMTRFRHEAEILGRLQHPNIAQVYDAGTFDEGQGAQPYFAMEFVKGEPLIRHAESKSLGIQDRLALFVRVCDAVQYAHHQGVIHRDLKPDNILVDDFTHIGELIGTVPYMSPEQVTGDPNELDTRSDVYSLGVVLYELICGRLPHDVTNRTIPEAVRLIREEEPTPLSSVNRTFRGDLETIVAKALEKDKNRRYQTAAELAADVRHYLGDQPIVARPPSTIYQLRKFARRNKALVGGLAATFVTLVAGLIGVSAMYVRALAAETDAEQRAADLEQVAEFQESQLADLNAAQMGMRLRLDLIERRRTALQLAGLDDAEIERGLLDLERSLEGVNFADVAKESLDVNIFEGTLQGIETQFADKPLVRAQLLQSVATVLHNLQMLDRAVAPQEEALAVRRRELGEAQPETLRSLVQAGSLAISQSRYDDADAYLRRAVETARRELGVEDRLTLLGMNLLGVLLHARGRYAEAEALLAEALRIGRPALGEEDPLVLTLIGNLGIVADARKKMPEAERHHREALQLRRRVLGSENPSTLSTSGRLGNCLRAQGRLEEAEPYLREALHGLRRAQGDEHWRSLFAMRDLARLLREMGNLEEAERLAAEAVQKGRQTWLDERPQGPTRFLLEHGRTLTALKHFGPAEDELLEALAMIEDTSVPITNPSWFKEVSSGLAKAFAELYEARYAAEPDAGHDAKAAEVQARIQAADAADAAGADPAAPGN